MMLSNKIRHLRSDLKKAVSNISNFAELSIKIDDLQKEVKDLKENLAQKNDLIDSINKRAGYLEKLNLIMSNDIVNLSNSLKEVYTVVEFYLVDEYTKDFDKKKNDYHWNIYWLYYIIIYKTKV